MGHDDLLEWIDRYERAWRTAGTGGLRDLFTEHVVYRPAPYAEPVVGLDRLAAFWEAERDGPDEAFTLRRDVVAVDGATGVARVIVRYGEPRPQEYTDLWIVRLADEGRAREFEEWPFWPGAPWVAGSST